MFSGFLERLGLGNVCLFVFVFLCKMYLNPGYICRCIRGGEAVALCWRPSHQDLFVSSHVYCVENECIRISITLARFDSRLAL